MNCCFYVLTKHQQNHRVCSTSCSKGTIESVYDTLTCSLQSLLFHLSLLALVFPSMVQWLSVLIRPFLPSFPSLICVGLFIIIGWIEFLSSISFEENNFSNTNQFLLSGFFASCPSFIITHLNADDM
jgi:hypothetical protein